MKVINIWAGPGAGKSTTATGVFYHLKKLHYSVELVTEYAKDMTWEKRHNILTDQLYVAAKQNRRLLRLCDHDIDYVITDSPLLMGLLYTPKDYLNGRWAPVMFELFNQYDNINYVLQRDASTYQTVGRNQTLEESLEIDQNIVELLQSSNIPFTTVQVKDDPVSLMVKHLTSV